MKDTGKALSAVASLLLLAVGAPATAQDAIQIDLATTGQPDTAAPKVMDIILSNFSFTPEDIDLRDGVEITLNLVNQGSGGHSFAAPEFFAAAQMDASTRKLIDKKGRVEVKKGESIRLTLVPQAGHFHLKCSHFLHAGFGMTGMINVE